MEHIIYMKKLVFVFGFLILASRFYSLDFLTFRNVDVSSSISATIPVDDAGASKMKADSGLRLRLAPVDMFFSIGLPLVKVCDLEGRFKDIVDFESWNDFWNLRYGVSLDISPGNFPVGAKIFAGSLSIGNSVSRFKYPCLSSSGAIKFPVLPGRGIKFSLPGITSGEKPFSVAISLSPTSRKSPLPTVQVAATMEEEYYASIYKRFPVSGLTFLTCEINAGSFVYGGEHSESWMQRNLPYMEDRFLSAGLEFFLESRRVKSFVGCNVTQSPFGGFYPWLRSSLSLVFPGFTFNGALFWGDDKMITASGSHPMTRFQFQLNPWGEWSAGKSKVSAGLFFQGSMKSDDPVFCSDYWDFVMRCDCRLRATGCTGSANLVFKYSTLSSELEVGGGASVLFRRKPFSSGAGLSFDCQEKKSSVSASYNLQPAKGIVDSISSSVSLDVSGFSISSTVFKLEASIRKVFQNVSLSSKLAVSVKVR